MKMVQQENTTLEEKDTTMISYDVLEQGEIEVLKALIDRDKWDLVLNEFGGEIEVAEMLDINFTELREWMKFWLED